MDFKLQLLKEYYESGSSMYGISKKYGVDDATFIRWVKLYESKSLSLPQELIELENQVYMARKKSIDEKPSSEMTELDPSLIPDNYFQQFLGVFVGLTVCLSATAS